MRTALLLALLLTALPGAAQEAGPSGPFFVYSGSFTTKSAARTHAREHGGWILRTDLYTGLTPGFFAVVRGPFRARADADTVLAKVRRHAPDALVRAAGAPILPRALGDTALLAAVLGDLLVDVSPGDSEANPCAPREPHATVLIGFADPVLGEDAPSGGFWVVERTGEIIPIRSCALDMPPPPTPTPDE